MAKKQLRTVKKSNRTGRLNPDEVRAAVSDLRDGRRAPRPDDLQFVELRTLVEEWVDQNRP